MEYLLFPEELRGDLGAAAGEAEQLVAEARRAVDATALADRLVVLGAVRVLQGRVLEAHGLLREARAGVPQDVARQLRALSGELLAVYEQFNTFPDGNGAGATEIENRWRGAADLQPVDAEWRGLLAGTSDPAARLEAWLAYAFLCNLRPSRYVLESVRYVPASVPAPQLLQTMLQTPDGVRQMSAAVGFVQGAAYADLAAADLCRRAGDHAQATERLARAREAYASAADGVGEGACALVEGDWLAAPFSTPLAWNLAIQDSGSEGSSLSVPLEADEGRVPDAADVERARRVYEDAAARFRTAAAPRGLSACALRQGYLAAMDGQFSAAREALEQATAGFARCGDERGQQLAATHLVMAAIGEGATAATNLLARARAIGDWGRGSGSFSFTLGLGILLNRWSRHWLMRRGDYERAVSASEAAGALYEGLGAPVNAAQTVVDRGTIYQALGERALALNGYEEALERYATALASQPRIGENLRQRIVMLGSNVFHLYLQQMDADGMDRSAARLAAACTSLPAAAEPTSSSDVEAWALRQLAASNVELASVLVPVYRARRLRDEGEGAAADALLDEAERALPAVGAGQRAFLEGIVLGERGQDTDAAAAYRRHLAAGGANAGFVGTLTSFMEAAGGAHAAAEVSLQGLRVHQQAFAAFVRVKAYDEAFAHLQAVERIAGPDWWKGDARPWQSLSDAAEVHEGLARSADAADHHARAAEHYDTAIAQLEARRSLLSRDELRTALSADKGAQYLYFQAARAAMIRQDRGRAFHYAERGRARALLDLMAAAVLVRESGRAGGPSSAGGDTHAGGPMHGGGPSSAGGPLNQWREANARLGLWRGLLAHERAKAQPDQARVEHLARQIAGDEMRLGDIEARLLEVAPAVAGSLRATAPVLDVDQVASRLPADTLLIEWMFLGGDLLAWAIDREGLAGAFAVSLDTRELAADVRRFHAICRERGPTRALAAALGDRLLGPFEPLLRRTSSLIVVPYGVAHVLPFHALTVDGRLLGDTHRIAYLPSASVLQFLERSGSAAPRRMLAVGNPRAMSFRPPLAASALPLAPLPAAATEAAYVASLFAPDATLLVGADATEAAVRAHLGTHSLLHLATHGNLVEDAPLASSLSLADGDELTVYELMGARLDADLVVLSACETARGATTGGDDVLGLTRALLAAGARSAVVSLWPVDDVSTSLFMGHFYRRLRAGADPAEALASAQRDLRAMTAAEIEEALHAVEEGVRSSGAGGIAVTPAATATPARELADRPEASPAVYRHPYYWAAFILIGQG